MKKKIIGLFVCMLMVAITAFPVAGIMEKTDALNSHSMKPIGDSASQGYLSDLKISNVYGGLLNTPQTFGIRVEITNLNPGSPLKDIEWSIKLTGGCIFLGKVTDGIIIQILPGDSEVVQSKFIFGFGTSMVTVTAQETGTQNYDTVTPTAQVFLFLMKVY
jgi:hypothetical protein